MPHREKAERCRRLGYEFIGDPVSEKLLQLAEEYEARSAESVHSGAVEGRQMPDAAWR